MALRGIYGYRQADHSIDYNARTAKIIDRSILDGGALSYTGTLLVSIAPFIAHSYDGLVVLSTETESVLLVDGQINYIVCYAQYQTNSDPVIMFRVITELEWETSINRLFFITFAKFDLSATGFALVNASHADYGRSDYSEKLGKNAWRPSVTSLAALPTIQNRVGDTRIVQDSKVPYMWTGTVWQAVGTTASNVVSTAYGDVSATDVQTAIRQLADISTALTYSTSLSDRIVHSAVAMTAPIYVPFTRRFLAAPTVTLSAAGTLETNVASAVVSDTTTDGFVLTITPTTATTAGTPAIFTLDRTWTA